jgi:CubicO group peptidase (beta-lactamase class C family)
MRDTSQLWRARGPSLQPRLYELARRKDVGEIAIVVGDAKETFAASTGLGENTPPRAVHIGCIAKLLTSTLFTLSMKSLKARWDDEVLDHLSVNSLAIRRYLKGIALSQLMDHTHGLDGSHLSVAPLGTDGSIDVEKLCYELVDAPRVAQPGEMYNYGNAGAHMAAAVLECGYGEVFGNILFSKLLSPLGIANPKYGVTTSLSPGSTICAATGGALQLSATEIFRFAVGQLPLDGATGASQERVFSRIRPLPGWHPLEKGIGIGWKYYGSDWWGHDGRSLNSAVLTRINRKQRVAIVLTSQIDRGDLGFLILGCLLGDSFPDLVSVSIPKLLIRETFQEVRANSYLGCYRNRRASLTISLDGGDLILKKSGAFEPADSASEIESTHRLNAAADNVFFTEPPDLKALPYLQFLPSPPAGKCEFIWNGRNLWRRAAL